MKPIAGGIYTALVTPFDGDGSVRYDVLESLTALNKKNGVNQFYVGGSSSEMTLLSVEERKAILRTVLAQKPDFCIAHVGGQNFRDSLTLARDAGAAGADAVSAVIPFYYPYTTAEIASYYRALAAESGLPVVLYNMPAGSGVTPSVDQLETLLEPDYMAGLKFTSRDLFLLERVKNSFPEKTVLNGCDEVLHSGLAAGADGAIGATYNILCDKAAALYRAWTDGDRNLCTEKQAELNRVIRTMLRFGGRKCVKALLEMLGFPVGVSRAPFLPLEREALDILREQALPYLTLDTEI